jgi:hypothetical protein
MPYVYQLTFDINSEDANQIQIGQSLQLSLSYLRALLPNEVGFVSCRAMYSLNHTDVIHLIFESIWQDWSSFQNHRDKSPFDEKRMLSEFEMKVKPLNVATHIYEEI